ncbi:mucin-22-like [Cydia pomonella]|uniref:mucin-22-like n=1 Tax=Cydia pomonella TaxID=82600 RepID=UPI002ADE5BE1|nr:mucin-22-like [Cydia pomonella]
MNCRYYTEQTLGWMLNNKLIVFLSLLCFCLFVSTLALSGQKGRLLDEVAELKAAMTTEAPTEAPANATEAPSNPDETTPATTEGTNPDGTDTNPDETSTATQPETGTETETGGGNNTDNGSEATTSAPEKSETVESANEENVNTSGNLRDIVKESKLLSLIAA